MNYLIVALFSIVIVNYIFPVIESACGYINSLFALKVTEIQCLINAMNDDGFDKAEAIGFQVDDEEEEEDE